MVPGVWSLLSRVASNLYWMSRLVERAENTARLLDVTWRMSLLVKEPALQDQEWFAPLNITGTLFPFSGRHNQVCAREVLHFMALDPENPSSIYACARQARENARAVRGSITSEMWEVLNSTWLEMQQMDEEKMHAHGISAFFDGVKERSHLFRGVTFGTMHRDDAYEFARLGTHMERADSTARILDVKYHILLPSVKEVGGAVDYYQWSAVLRSVSAFEAYRKVYRDVITPLKLAELLVLRDDIPRSLHFCLRHVCETLGHVQNDQSGETLRRAGQILAQLQYGRISEIFAEGLHEYLTEFLRSMQELSGLIQRSFFAATLVE
ncbi:MAG TPA: alpha-E domain-containing protein [Usitatibacter sp.]|nr:alpha-E domain-containing protein [Usitatibacter sp.]